MERISKPTLVRNGEEVLPETNRAARAAVLVHARALIAFALGQASEGATFEDFEKALVGHVLALARAVARRDRSTSARQEIHPGTCRSR